MTDEKVNGTVSRHFKIKFGGDNQAAPPKDKSQKHQYIFTDWKPN
jgi:hypothetical protein